MSTNIKKGMRVVVSHLQGEEEGVVESLNYKSGRVLVYFDYPACPHFDSFLLEQITTLTDGQNSQLA